MCTFILGSRPYSRYPRKEPKEKLKKSFGIQEKTDVGRATVSTPGHSASTRQVGRFGQLRNIFESIVCPESLRYRSRKILSSGCTTVDRASRLPLVFHNGTLSPDASITPRSLVAPGSSAKVGKVGAMDFCKKLTTTSP